jgi:3-hydroxyisobutyrate dehydrogenase-like beta-hydroxyacid dehydrogenase
MAPPLDNRPGFGVSLAIKDAEHASSIANDVKVKLPNRA